MENNKLIVTAHQPDYFPYPGLFHKLILSDVFVILDNVQFKFDITNRNKIISKDGKWARISVPVKKNQTHKKIIDVEINNDVEWKNSTIEKIIESYTTSKYFLDYKEYFVELYQKKWDMLFELNYEILKKIIEWLGIKIKIVRESELDIVGKSTQKLVNICKALDAETYISGSGGKNYLNEKLFHDENIKLKYQNYKPVLYQQNLSKDFVPNLSIIDLLANYGKDSLKIILEQNELK